MQLTNYTFDLGLNLNIYVDQKCWERVIPVLHEDNVSI